MAIINRLRILVALAVLRNIPEDETPSTYISSLKDAFPSFSSSFKTPGDFWENHARQLEKECIELRTTLESLQIRSFLEANPDPTMKQTQQTEVSASPSSVPVPSGASKKKSKKKSEPNGELIEEDSLVDILKQGKTKLGSGKLFQSLDIFLQLYTRHSLPGFPRPAFFIATREVFKSLAEFFKDATKQQTNLKSIRMLQVALCSVVNKAVPLAASWLVNDDEALSLLFEQLLELLINGPIIPSFMAVSEHNLVYLRNVDSSVSPSRPTSSSSAASYVDGRASILALLQATLVHVRSSLSSIACDEDVLPDCPDLKTLARADFSVMIHSLLLGVIRHLQDILRDNDGKTVVTRTRFQRIKRLAVKDTFWYLCSVMHFLFGLQNRTTSAIFSSPCEGVNSEPRQILRVRLLRETIIDVMEDLVIYQDRIRASLLYTASYGRVPERSLPLLQEEEGPEFTPSASKLMDYVILDDMEYRMLLRLVERFLSMPSMP